MTWERREGIRASRVAVYRDFTLPDDAAAHDEAAAWATDHIVAMLAVLEPLLRPLAGRLRRV